VELAVQEDLVINLSDLAFNKPGQSLLSFIESAGSISVAKDCTEPSPDVQDIYKILHRLEK
jgi:hypothetical protein